MDGAAAPQGGETPEELPAEEVSIATATLEGMNIFRCTIVIAIIGGSIWLFFSRNEPPPAPEHSEDVTRVEIREPDTTQVQQLSSHSIPSTEGANLSIEDKRNVTPLVNPPLEFHQATNSLLTPDSLLRDDQGNLFKTNQKTAMKACAQRKMHLPTMRELAQLAQSRGAKGILEISDTKEGVNSENLPILYSLDGTEENTYSLVDVVNPDQKRDTFYYNPRGYMAPADESERQRFISSSVDTKGLEHDFGLNGKNGVLGGQGENIFDGSPGTAQGFVLCLKSK